MRRMRRPPIASADRESNEHCPLAQRPLHFPKNRGRRALSTIELTYTGRERSFVTWSAILGYAFDFYNLIIMAFLLTQIQKSLGMTLPQTGLIVSMTLTGSVIGGVAIGWLGDRIGRKNALLASLALLAAGSILSAFAWDFFSLLAFRFHRRHRSGRRMGRRHGAPQRGLAQRTPRLWFLRGAGDVGRRDRNR